MKKYILHNRDIILLSNQMFHDRYWTSKQYITVELIKNNRVLYVEGNYSFGKLVSGLFNRTWPVKPFGNMTQERENLFILTPFPRIPLRNHFRLFGWLNKKLLLFKIRRAGKKLKMNNPVFWTFLHQSADLVGKLDESLTIYHCVDDWPILLPIANMGRSDRIRGDEKKLISCVDVVFRVSVKLLDYLKIPNTKVFDIPNGVDIDLFDPKRYSNESQKYDLIDLPRPIIGFSGSIGRWIDIELIIHIAKCYKNASIVLIGLNEKNPNISELQNFNNIYFLGMKSREEVPQYIYEFDVCLMPFKRTKIGEGLLPLKMFEYLALGKPVVATSSEVLKQFKNVLYLADDKNAFLEEIENAITNSDKIKSDFRRMCARKYSWKNRMTEYETAISDVLQ